MIPQISLVKVHELYKLSILTKGMKEPEVSYYLTKDAARKVAATYGYHPPTTKRGERRRMK